MCIHNYGAVCLYPCSNLCTTQDTDGTDEFRSNDIIAKSILMYIDGDYNNTDYLWIMPTARVNIFLSKKIITKCTK